MSSKPQVLIVGATGRAGTSIVQGLLKSNNFRVAALVRSASLSKPAVQSLTSSDVEIRVGDVSDPAEKLAAYLDGVDILILLVLPMVDQKPVLLAAKEAGVKRVVPSDFAVALPRGSMTVSDIKLDTREFIKFHSIPHTFINIGWWTELMFPYPSRLQHELSIYERSTTEFRGAGNVKVALTAFTSTGEFVARIINDPRTLNRAVITWDVEASLSESWEVAGKVSGEDFSKNRRVPDEELCKMAESDAPVEKLLGQYYLAVLVRGEGSLQKALDLGDLDARELYPDYKPVTLEEEARKFYSDPPRFNYDI